MSLSMGSKVVKSITSGVQILMNPYLWNNWTDYCIQTFMELSRHVVVQSKELSRPVVVQLELRVTNGSCYHSSLAAAEIDKLIMPVLASGEISIKITKFQIQFLCPQLYKCSPCITYRSPKEYSMYRNRNSRHLQSINTNGYTHCCGIMDCKEILK